MFTVTSFWLVSLVQFPALSLAFNLTVTPALDTSVAGLPLTFGNLSFKRAVASFALPLAVYKEPLPSYPVPSYLAVCELDIELKV